MSDLLTITCPNCCIVFGIPPEAFDSWQKIGKEIYCPNGCRLHWVKDPEPENQLENLTAERDAALAEVKKLTETVAELRAELEIWRPRTE